MDLRLRIKKRTQIEWLVWLLVFVPFSFGLLFDFLPLPNLLKYSIDLVWIILTVTVFINVYRQKVVFDSKLKTAFFWIVSFLLMTFLVYVFNYQSALYYLMGVRNNFRFYMAFLAFAVFLEFDEIKSFIKSYDVLFWINAAVMLFQFIFLGYKQDYLGGLFGTQSGCNGYINIFFVIICANSIVRFLDKCESLWFMLSKCGVALLLATLAEIKFFFIEFVVIIVAAVLVSGNSWRKTVVIIGGVFAVVLFVNLLILIFPYFAELNTFEMLLQNQSKGYTGEDTISRLSAISHVTKLYLNTVVEKLFGLGLGNCDTSNIDFLNTPFYKEHGFIRYFWFSTAHVTLETGLIGFAMFVGFFLLVLVISVILSRKDKKNRVYYNLSTVVSVCCVLIVIYNSSLRTEAAYMIYFILSLPFALQKINNEEKIQFYE